MRIRSIKPAFFHDEDLAELPALTRILFAGLWTLADGSGRSEYRPRYIKAQVLPYDDCDVEKMLDALSDGDFIQIYEVENRRYIQIPNFAKHQRITGKEAEEGSTLPPPPKHRGNNGETTVKQSGNNGETSIVQEGKGREKEGKGKEMSVAADAAPRLKPPHVSFVDAFSSSYESVTGQKYKTVAQDFVIASKLLKDYGEAACVEKARVLGTLCRDGTAWFTKGGWGSFTIGTLSNKWNEILPRKPTPTKDDELKEELKRQEGLRAAADRLINRS